jgi:hypothetical protein
VVKDFRIASSSAFSAKGWVSLSCFNSRQSSSPHRYVCAAYSSHVGGGRRNDVIETCDNDRGGYLNESIIKIPLQMVSKIGHTPLSNDSESNVENTQKSWTSNRGLKTSFMVCVRALAAALAPAPVCAVLVTRDTSTPQVARCHAYQFSRVQRCNRTTT